MLLYNYNTSTLFYHTPMNIHRILLAKYNNYDNKMYLYSIHLFISTWFIQKLLSSWFDPVMKFYANIK